MPSQVARDTKIGETLQRIFSESNGGDPGLLFPSPLGVVSRARIEQLLRILKKGEEKKLHFGVTRPFSKSVERRDVARHFTGRRSGSFSSVRRSAFNEATTTRPVNQRRKIRRGKDDRRTSQSPLATDNLGFTEKTLTADLMRFLRKMDIQDSGLSGLK